MKQKIAIVLSAIVIAGILLPTIHGAPIPNVAPAPHTTYNKGDSYTTVYSPSEIAPPNGSKPPIITVTSLVNNTVVTSNNLTLTFDLILESPSTYHPIILQGLCYKPSWRSDNVTIGTDSNNQFISKTITFSIFLTNLEDGVKSVTIYASTMYEFETGRENIRKPVSPSGMIVGNFLYVYSNYYFIEGSSTIDFLIDTSPKTNSSPTPTIPEFPPLTTIPLLLSAIAVVLASRNEEVQNQTS